MDDKAIVTVRFPDNSGATFQVPAQIAREIAYMVERLRTNETSLADLLRRRVFSRGMGE